MKIKIQTKLKIEEIDLKEKRLKAGITLVELQDETGIAFSYLSALERGKMNGVVQYSTYQKIYKALKKLSKK